MGTNQCFAYGQGRSNVVPIRNGAFLSKQTITSNSSTATQSTAMPTGTEYVVIEASEDCHFKVDALESTADATATDPTVRTGENGEFLIGAEEFFSLIDDA